VPRARAKRACHRKSTTTFFFDRFDGGGVVPPSVRVSIPLLSFEVHARVRRVRLPRSARLLGRRVRVHLRACRVDDGGAAASMRLMRPHTQAACAESMCACAAPPSAAVGARVRGSTAKPKKTARRERMLDADDVLTNNSVRALQQRRGALEWRERFQPHLAQRSTAGCKRAERCSADTQDTRANGCQGARRRVTRTHMLVFGLSRPPSRRGREAAAMWEAGVM
jgi:hypothetical protein